MVLHDEKAARPVDVVAGNLQIRLAESEEEVAAAQALRYRVFYEEMRARPTDAMLADRRDFDFFDDYCDHLLVIDRSFAGGRAGVVGTYRFMRRSDAERCGRFYTSDEYDISQLLAYPGEIMELGRSCVHPDYRSGATMALLWRGIAEYSVFYDIQLMFGCASLPGVELEDNRLTLAYLHRHHLAPAGICPRAVESRFVDLAAFAAAASDEELAKGRQTMPPLIKGYLRVGGYIGEGAVIDHAFGTTDVCIIVKTALVTAKYFRHYRFERQQDEEELGRLGALRRKRKAG